MIESEHETLKEDPAMTDYRIISADSHFVEPPNMWAERIDKKFRDRAPHTVKGLNGKEGEFFICENISSLPVAAAFGAGFRNSSNFLSAGLRASRRIH